MYVRKNAKRFTLCQGCCDIKGLHNAKYGYVTDYEYIDKNEKPIARLEHIEPEHSGRERFRLTILFDVHNGDKEACTHELYAKNLEDALGKAENRIRKKLYQKMQYYSELMREIHVIDKICFDESRML